MKKIELSEKTKKIIAWIMIVIMGIFSAIGIMTCLGGIYSCATKNKAEVKKVYAEGESETRSFIIPIENIIQQVQANVYQNYKSNNTIRVNINKNGISVDIISGTTSATVNPATDVNNKYKIYIDDATFTNTSNGETIAKGIYIEFIKTNLTIENSKIIPLTNPTYGTTITDENMQTITLYTETGEISEAIIIQITTEDGDKFIPTQTKGINGGINERIAYNLGYKNGNENKEAYGKAQKEIGRQEGIAQANEYSFTGLISAVFDVPIQTLYGMLNFEILGVNILTVITSVLSIGLIIFVLKLIFG